MSIREMNIETLIRCHYITTARKSSQSILKEISLGVSSEGLMLKLKLHILATWCEELTHWERPWCWERLKVRGEGDDRGWDGWMASPTQWTWVWVKSRSWWWTGRPVVLQSMGSQRVGHDWVTELNWNLAKDTPSFPPLTSCYGREGERRKWWPQKVCVSDIPKCVTLLEFPLKCVFQIYQSVMLSWNFPWTFTSGPTARSGLAKW